MTPGAWRKEGYTCKLQDETSRQRSPSPPGVGPTPSLLIDLAAGASGRSPPEGALGRFPAETTGTRPFPGSFWRTPDASGITTSTTAARSPTEETTPLVGRPRPVQKDGQLQAADQRDCPAG